MLAQLLVAILLKFGMCMAEMFMQDFKVRHIAAAFHKLLPTADKVVAVGSFQLDIMKQLGLRSDQGVFDTCGAPLKQFSTLRYQYDGKIRNYVLFL